jgi:hypothetical protein
MEGMGSVKKGLLITVIIIVIGIGGFHALNAYHSYRISKMTFEDIFIHNKQK